MVRRLWNSVLDRVCGPVEDRPYPPKVSNGEAYRDRFLGPLDGDLQTAVAKMMRGMHHVRRP